MYVKIDIVWKVIEKQYDLDFPPWYGSYHETEYFYVLENLATGKTREVSQEQFLVLKREGLIRDV